MSAPTDQQSFNFTATVPVIDPPNVPGAANTVYHLTAALLEIRDTSYIFTDQTGMNIIGVFPLGTVITRDDAVITP